MRKNTKQSIYKKLLVLGLITAYLCMATACGTNKNNGNNSGSMAASPIPSASPATQETATQQTTETGTAATDMTEGTVTDSTMGDTNGNGDSMMDNAGNAIGDAGDTVGNIVDDAANGVADITNDIVGGDNTGAGTAGTSQR